MTFIPPHDHLQQLGYALLTGVFSPEEMEPLAGRLAVALQADQPSVLRSRGATYGSRDLTRLLPEICELPRHARLREFVTADLGPRAGLVRALYFDKPPESSWSLPPHKDRTIAVKSHGRQSAHFRRPTIKAGIPHVEAAEPLLARMLTLRIHLDPMTLANGPLSVVPGSHITSNNEELPAVEIHARVGDVLAMRPLLTHSSSLPHQGTTMRRRVIHLELAAYEELPDGYEWDSFHAVCV
ncbi:MAG TPA: phytanoyl-CoA dioxygenase family protein [Pirellulales bacterium]|jgi:hypothetical protein